MDEGLLHRRGEFEDASGQRVRSGTGGGAGVFADVHLAASAEMDVDGAAERREHGVDAGFVAAGDVAREPRLEHVEADVVLRRADEIPEAIEQESAAPALGKSGPRNTMPPGPECGSKE